MSEVTGENQTAKRKLLAVFISCVVGWFFSYFATNILTDYAYGLFIWLPTVMGAITTMIFGYKNNAGKSEMRNLSYLSLGIFCLGLLTFAWEGIMCLIMAAPIGLFFTWVGYRIGYKIIKSKLNGNAPTIMLFFIVSIPAFMGFESSVKITDDLRSITTSVEIAASPEIVWKNIVGFPELNQPKELIFKMGIAYPISAEIDGHGIGAIRHCNFSTGSFVEPITVWDEPNLLKFKVDNQPATMKELSFYDIKPTHIRGYWVSKQGQFKLTKLSNGHTLLEGTTWYENKIRPGFYWSLWSDYIVHKIHKRVLEHIKDLSELESERIESTPKK